MSYNKGKRITQVWDQTGFTVISMNMYEEKYYQKIYNCHKKKEDILKL